MPDPIERDTVIPGPGVELPARWYLPEAAPGRHPAVVLGPGGIEKGMIDSIAWLARPLAAAGFAVLTTTWRAGSPRHDADDLSLALDALQREPRVDAARAGVFGMSRGGMSALRAASRDERIRAVASFGSPTDLLQHVRGVAAYAPGRHRMLVQWLGGEPDENRAFYEEVQAFSHAARIRQPVLCVHGAYDMHVPVEQSIWMHRELQRHGNERAQLLVIPAMNHYADMAGRYAFDFEAVSAPVTAFFRRWLSDQGQ